MAKKYFGSMDPVGQYLALENEKQLLMVEGVVEDVPENAHFHFDFLISYVTLKTFGEGNDEYYSWADFGHFNYIKVQPGTDKIALEQKILPWVAQYVNWDDQTIKSMQTGGIHFALQPITDIHLNSDLRWELEKNGNAEYVLIMLAAAVFILLIACFNFMNLSTAKSMERANEVGVRKSLGAARNQLVRQFLGESILITLSAMLVAGLLVEITLPNFNAIMGKNIVFNILNPLTLLLFIMAAISIGVVAGFYPAVILSGLNPISILKGKFSSSTNGQTVRTVLVVAQFAISVFLIAGAITILNQLQYLKNKDLGFNREALITIPVHSSEISGRMEVIKNELQQVPGILSVGASSNIPGKQFNQNNIFLKSEPKNRVSSLMAFVDESFIPTMGLELVDGRMFDKTLPSDYRSKFIINERAALELGLKDPVGTVMILDLEDEPVEGEIIGVLKDFNFISLHSPIRPLVMQMIPAYNHMVLRINMKDVDAVIPQTQEILSEFDDVMFKYEFMDEILADQYQNETKMASLFSSFAILAIVLACLGLGGLAAINFSYRKKEIGIRKVLGASTPALISGMLSEYTLIILSAIVFALPLYFLLMKNWLNNFTYHITLRPVVFGGSAVGILLLAWITLSILSLRTVRSNPVDALKEN
jgi:putative ABC transport system permease protein